MGTALAAFLLSVQPSLTDDRAGWTDRVDWIASLDPTSPEPADLIRQSGDTDCGPAVLTMILNHYRPGELTLEDIEAVVSVGSEGMNLLDIKQIAERQALITQGLRVSLERLAELPMPVVAHVFDNHFVVLRSVGKDVVVDDPAIGRLRMTPETFHRAWDGIVLTFAPVVSQSNILPKGGSSALDSTGLPRGEHRSPSPELTRTPHSVLRER